ncbi:hypothetical protein [Niabella ginsengisoli]|uniref:Beta-lactamase-inhibitor-like PepSY-like domain-containing protein n=1 Tax=Niabella ginsengisoli TaxID=522298 RepID=A0ABS9SI18_9BACT|nr:hypothetical protein [Niabella ginsengisoli]MCH5597980.1 hypothetical protein [Niabella ginsengisoli]
MSSIAIGNNKIVFSNETTISHIEVFKNAVCFSTCPLESDLDDSKIETHQIWKERCKNNPSELFCYNKEGLLKWKFSEQNVVGFGKIIPELEKEENFITIEHYRKYLEKFKGKELLEVYVGSWPYDYRYVIDANSGEIYDKMKVR